jgi:hypothetical protein
MLPVQRLFAERHNLSCGEFANEQPILNFFQNFCRTSRAWHNRLSLYLRGDLAAIGNLRVSIRNHRIMSDERMVTFPEKRGLVFSLVETGYRYDDGKMRFRVTFRNENPKVGSFSATGCGHQKSIAAGQGGSV